MFDADVATPVGMVAANASLTLRAVAGLPNAAPLDACEALAAHCFDSDDYMEGRAAFLEKRAPIFRGR